MSIKVNQEIKLIIHYIDETSSIFNAQLVATHRNRVAKRNMLRPTMLRYVVLKCCDRLARAFKSWVSNVGICFVDMLLSFGRGLIKVRDWLRARGIAWNETL